MFVAAGRVAGIAHARRRRWHGQGERQRGNWPVPGGDDPARAERSGLGQNWLSPGILKRR